jgi:hypothetical protein
MRSAAGVGLSLDLTQYLLAAEHEGGGPRTRSALQGLTWALRGLEAWSTATGGLASLYLLLPEDDDSTNSREFIIALDGG